MQEQPLYVCPLYKTPLKNTATGLMREDGKCYPFLANINDINPIPVFIDENMTSGGDAISQAMYRKADAECFYENYLTWLFSTFHANEATFRKSLVEKLHIKKGSRVLITGCGLGDDLEHASSIIGPAGKIFAQDISDIMVAATARRIISENKIHTDKENIYLSVSNASMLPYPDGYFDAAYHFGGINLFSDMKSAISEMARVVKVGGKVVLGDEGVAPWLKGTEYGNIAITNNKLWASEAPVSMLPETASNVNLTWVLGNCFYVIDFEISNAKPFIDLDIEHKGMRGGSMRKRYFGQLEGVDPIIKQKIISAASAAGVSVSAWLERTIENSLVKPESPPL